MADQQSDLYVDCLFELSLGNLLRMLLYLRHNMLMTHLLMRHIDLVRVWSRNVASSLCKMTHIGLSSSAMNASAGEDCSHPHVEDLVPNLIRDYISGHDKTSTFIWYIDKGKFENPPHGNSQLSLIQF